MNGDGQVEALFIDEGPCYKPDGRWYAVAAQSADGAWRRILEGEGSLHATGAASGDGSSWPRPAPARTKELRYDGHVYASADHAPAARPLRRPIARRTRRCVGRGRRARAQGRALSDRRMESARQVRATVAGRAGLDPDRRRRSGACGKAWKGCEGSSSVDKDGVEIKDLNGDGRPEAVITDSGTDCYGNAGQGFTVLRAVPGGWKTMAQETGIPMFLDEHGAQNYPDIEVGGPGTCFPVERWNGKSYRLARRPL